MTVIFCWICISCSAAYVQKNAAVKGLSRNQKSVTAIAKSDVADKSSATRTSNRLAGKNIVRP